MRSAARSIIPVALVLLSGGCASPQAQRIEQTQDVVPDSNFCFTISPDDRWLVFFTKVDVQSHPQLHPRYGNLRILNLDTGDLRSIALSKEQGPNAITSADGYWRANSSECILPPPPAPETSPPPETTAPNAASTASPAPGGIVIRFDDPDNPRVEAAGATSQTLAGMRCSDCFLHTNDVDLMKKYVGEESLHWGDDPRSPNEDAIQVVSPDGMKIYFQKWPAKTEKPQFHPHSLFELDLTTGKSRKLIAFRDEHPVIDRLRPSPDGTRLAYQLTTGFGFLESRPSIYVLDLRTLSNRRVATADGDVTMHWNSTSDKLYFYCQNSLYVTDVPPETGLPRTEALPKLSCAEWIH